MELPWPLLAAGGVSLAGLVYWVRRERTESARLRSRLHTAALDLERLQLSFTRFAPHEVVERIASSGVPDTGERKEVTVLFADLVGFTALCESVDPTILVRILNGYFERMSRAITDHGGHISTLIGDGILALFGAIEPNPWQGRDAVRTAFALRGAIADYNDELSAEGLPRLAIGVGLHRGTGIAGLVGSREMMAFTVGGRTINVAARVEALTREHGVDILLTRAVQEALDPSFKLRALPPEEIRGIAEPIELFVAEQIEDRARSGDS